MTDLKQQMAFDVLNSIDDDNLDKLTWRAYKNGIFDELDDISFILCGTKVSEAYIYFKMGVLDRKSKGLQPESHDVSHDRLRLLHAVADMRIAYSQIIETVDEKYSE